MKKKVLSIGSIIIIGLLVCLFVSFVGGTNEISADGHTFTITEVTNESAIDISSGEVDASQHWDYNGCYAPAFIVTIDGAQFFGYCIDVACQYTPSATYEASRIEGDAGRLAATILTYGFHGGDSIVDESDEGIGWRDTWLALRNVLDVDRAWSSDGSIALTEYCNTYLLPEGSYCYKFTYNDGEEAQAIVAVPIRASEFGSIKVVKTDEETGESLDGATFEVTGPSGSKILANDEVWEGLEPGDYTVKELSAPYGYMVSNIVATVTVKAGKTEVVTCADERIKGRIILHKTGESRNNTTITENGITYPYENLSGAVFELYANEDIVTGYGDIVYEAGDLVSMAITNENGDAVIEGLYFGDYYIIETSAPEGYRIIEDSFDLTVGTSENVAVVEYELDCVNYLQKGNVIIHKLSSEDDAPLAGAEFAIYDSDMNLVSNVVSDENGSAAFNNLLVGSYHYQETKAPTGYVLDSTIYNLEIVDGETVEVTLKNDVERGSYQSSEFYNDNSATTGGKTTSKVSSPNTGISKDSVGNVLRKLVPIAAAVFVMVGLLAYRHDRKKNR